MLPKRRESETALGHHQGFKSAVWRPLYLLCKVLSCFLVMVVAVVASGGSRHLNSKQQDNAALFARLALVLVNCIRNAYHCLTPLGTRRSSKKHYLWTRFYGES